MSASLAADKVSGNHPVDVICYGRQALAARSSSPPCGPRAEGGDTVLMGVLAEAEAAGLELIEVRRVPPPDDPRAPWS